MDHHYGIDSFEMHAGDIHIYEIWSYGHYHLSIGELHQLESSSYYIVL